QDNLGLIGLKTLAIDLYCIIPDKIQDKHIAAILGEAFSEYTSIPYAKATLALAFFPFPRGGMGRHQHPTKLIDINDGAALALASDQGRYAVFAGGRWASQDQDAHGLMINVAKDQPRCSGESGIGT